MKSYFQFDDEKVKKIDLDIALKQNPYVLFYILTDEDGEEELTSDKETPEATEKPKSLKRSSETNVSDPTQPFITAIQKKMRRQKDVPLKLGPIAKLLQI